MIRKPSPPLDRVQLEKRRLRALVELKDPDWSGSEIARRHGVTRTTVSRWRQALRDGGNAALRRRRAAGRPPKVAREALRALARPQISVLEFQAAIETKFRIRYDRDHCYRLLKQLGVTDGIVQRRPRTVRSIGETKASAGPPHVGTNRPEPALGVTQGDQAPAKAGV